MKQKAAARKRDGFFAGAEIIDLGPAVNDRGYRISYLLATVCGAALFSSTWALTFWI
jgi:hypothetical protein